MTNDKSVTYTNHSRVFTSFRYVYQLNTNRLSQLIMIKVIVINYLKFVIAYVKKNISYKTLFSSNP